MNLKEVNTQETNNMINNSLRKNKINFVFKKDGNYEIHSTHMATFYQHMNKLGFVNKVYDTDNLPNDVFVYEYRQPWTVEPADFFGINGVGFLELDPCPDNVQKRIHEKTAFLILTIPYESPLQPHRLRAMHQYLKKHGFPPSQVIYLTCCLNATELYKEYCDSIGEVPLCIMDYSIENLTIHSTLSLDLKDSQYDTRLRKKTFLMFNRRWASHPHRSLFLYNIFKMNLLDSFFISFNKTDVASSRIYSEIIREQYSEFFYRPGVPLDLGCLDKLESILPLYLDTNDLVTSSLMYEKFDLTKKLYDDSFINIVSETYFHNTSNVIHITEKTFKPILYMQPFIILGPPTILKKLREMGFKTFDTVWDESYDETLDHTERFYKILELCEKINRWPAIKKVMAMKQCKSIVEHNFNVLLKFNDEKKLVLDFIKRHKLSPYI
jgi:hypothetical protein